MMVNETLEAIRRRRSTRTFAYRQADEEALISVVDAGRHAPYGGEDLRYFAVVQDRDVLEAINGAAKDMAMNMESEHFQRLGADPRFHCFYKAPTLVIVSAAERDVSPEADCAAATENMLIAAESVGLGACWAFFPLLAFYGPEGEEFRRVLRFPPGYRAYTSVAIGHKREPEEGYPIRRSDAVTFI